MKHLQYIQKRKPASIDISLNASGFEGKSRDDSAQKIHKQTLAVSEVSSDNPIVADRIRNSCVYILMFALTCHAVVSKLKNSFGKNVLTTEDGLKILRVIFLAGRNIAYGDFPERLLTQFMATAQDLYAQIDAVSVISDNVVSVFWQCCFSLWLH